MTKKATLKTEKINPPSPKASEEQGEEKQEDVKNIFNPEGELVVDVFETNSDFVVSAAIAGAQIKDIDISVEKDMMVIKGHRQNPHDNLEKKYFYQECYWGPFSRKIILPENVNTEEADAQMDRGILMIKIPKTTAKEKPNIKVS